MARRKIKDEPLATKIIVGVLFIALLALFVPDIRALFVGTIPR